MPQGQHAKHPDRAVAFIGTGVMGSAMARRMMGAGYALTVHTRTPSRAQPLVDDGARWADSVGEAVADADAVVTMVAFPADVRAVYLEAGGVIERARAGALLVDMTTSDPALAREIAAKASERGLSALDAPVSGGDIGAAEGTLSIMVGGEAAAVARAKPLLSAMGSTVVHQGPAGSGQYTKMANQIAIASTMMGVMEALVFAEEAGLEPERVLRSIASGAAGSWSMDHLVPRAMARDMAPGFYVRHFRKDLGIARDAAGKLGLELQGLQLAASRYDELARAGGDDLGTQALYLVISGSSGAEGPGSDRAGNGA